VGSKDERTHFGFFAVGLEEMKEESSSLSLFCSLIATNKYEKRGKYRVLLIFFLAVKM
jgi:hypothetical protein